MMRKARDLGVSCFVVALGSACMAKPSTAPLHYSPLPAKQAEKAAANDDSARLGGRLYDHLWLELRSDFVPDDPKTPEADGKGGPFGNGTLADADGKPMLNTGHDYRLKNLLGWDLHGASGISGPELKATACVLLPDLLQNTEPREVWRTRLSKGEDAIPAYASVLTPAQIEALLDFMLGVREGVLPRPDAVFALDEKVPGFYRLTPGGNAARGHALIEKTCKSCHGADGTAFALQGDDDGKHSLGTFLRSDAAEAWLKILVGNAGSKMGPQLPLNISAGELTQQLHDIFAAGCDRTRYPKGPGVEVPDGDARCGGYLK